MIAFTLALLWSLLTGQGHVDHYSYPNGQSGITVQVSQTQCIGYDMTPGQTGVYGNILGVKGGDCS